MSPRVWMLALLVLAVSCTSTSGGDDASFAPSPSESAPAEALAPAESPVADPSDSSSELLQLPHLDVAYRDCLLDQGFDPVGVQVLVDSTGVPWWVKTGHNVPSGLHGYCFEAIGGAPTSNTSYGVPIDQPLLGDLTRVCGTISLSDWRVDLEQYPVFAGDLPDPVANGLGVSATPDGGWLDGVTWREISRLPDRLVLLGQRAQFTKPLTEFVYADLANVDGEWLGSAWGNCNLRLQAQGWELASLAAHPDKRFTADSTSITVHATEFACASGKPPGSRSLAELVAQTDQAVYVVVFVEKQWLTLATCPDNPAFEAQFQLTEPLGDRTLIDISGYPYNPLPPG